MAEVETCDECGFDGSRWTPRDCASFFRAMGWWWRHAFAGVDPEVLGTDPAPEVWSALMYALHTRIVTGVWVDVIERVHADDGVVLEKLDVYEAERTSDAELFRDRMLDEIESIGARFADVIDAADRAMWDHVGTAPWGDSSTALAGTVHAVHDASHHMFDIARNLAALGAAPALAGTVEQINVSGGGVPKTPVLSAEVGLAGVVGDVQKERKHHGRPFQALCLWSAEVVEELAAEGHPIGFGSAGENLTVRGVDWTALKPGVLLRVGSVLAELSFPAVPCKKQTQWFSDGDFRRIAFERNPQWVRWYAWVREPGAIATGDAVTSVTA